MTDRWCMVSRESSSSEIEISISNEMKTSPKLASQLFSSAGQVYADRHSNLTAEYAEKLLFLAYNIRLLGFRY